MIVLGLDTMMASVETTITSVLDVLPWLKQTRLRRFLTISGICIFFLIFGILFCLRSGTYWVGKFKQHLSLMLSSYKGIDRIRSLGRNIQHLFGRLVSLVGGRLGKYQRRLVLRTEELQKRHLTHAGQKNDRQ